VAIYNARGDHRTGGKSSAILMTIHRVLSEDTGILRLRSVPDSAKYRRYAEVAQRLAKQHQGSDRLMWAQLAALWDGLSEWLPRKRSRPACSIRVHVEELERPAPSFVLT
jgi:hypothetical protein